jgi:hypothetical protein
MKRDAQNSRAPFRASVHKRSSCELDPCARRRDHASMPGVTAVQRKELIARYENGPKLIRDALAKVPADALHWKPAPDRWSAHEVVQHCADSETNSAARIRFLIGEEHPTIAGYDQDRWAVRMDYRNLPLEPALKQLEALRAWTTALLTRLPESAWSRTGTHTESGHYTAEKWLEIYAEHLEVHARQIARNVEEFAKSKR